MKLRKNLRRSSTTTKTTIYSNQTQPRTQRRRKERKRLRSNLNLTKREDNWQMRVREILPNYNQRKEEIPRKKITGLDLQDNVFRREFWAWEDEVEEERLLKLSLSLQRIVMKIRVTLCLREEERKKDKIALKWVRWKNGSLEGFLIIGSRRAKRQKWSVWRDLSNEPKITAIEIFRKILNFSSIANYPPAMIKRTRNRTKLRRHYSNAKRNSSMI